MNAGLIDLVELNGNIDWRFWILQRRFLFSPTHSHTTIAVQFSSVIMKIWQVLSCAISVESVSVNRRDECIAIDIAASDSCASLAVQCNLRVETIP
jgi:hypothetical protein